MKRLFVLTLIVIVAIAFAFVGCAYNGEDTDSDDQRFERIYFQTLDVDSCVQIYQDEETGVEYLFIKSGRGSGLCPLQERMMKNESN